MIQIGLHGKTVEVGRVVSGTVTWSVEGRPPEGVLVTVGYRTEGRGTVDSRFVSEKRQDLSDSAFGSLPTLGFQLRIPSDGPVSYDGDLIRVIWEVGARLEIPWGRDEKAAAVVRVAPGR